MFSYINASNWPRIPSANPNLEIYCAGSYLPCGKLDWATHYKPFACLQINTQTHEITGIRDHFGQEPFFYTLHNNQLIFGSSLPDIIKHLPIHPQYDADYIVQQHYASPTGLSPPYNHRTHLKGLFRVKAGHQITFKPNSQHSSAFWKLNPHAKIKPLPNEQDYIVQFEHLLHEGLKHNTAGHQQIGLELSGGLDSATVLLGTHHIGIKPRLYSHVAPPNTEELDDFQNALLLTQTLKLPLIKQIDAQGFDPLGVFEACAETFAGAPTFVFNMLADNVHQQVMADKNTLLLSGFGGDECVSGHAPHVAFLPELIRHRKWKQAWLESQAAFRVNHGSQPSAYATLKQLLSNSHPLIRTPINLIHAIRGKTKGDLLPLFKSVRQQEHAMLQGKYARHVYMRIEDCAVRAKQQGFQYAYPLLYPPLVEFCFQLPLSLKRRNGRGRYLIRRYLENYVPEPIYNKDKKFGGILPATLHVCKTLYRSGEFETAFADLPFSAHFSEQATVHMQILNRIYAYMLKHYAQKVGIEWRYERKGT